MSDLFPAAPRVYQFTGEELAHELNREIAMREHVYPRRIEAGTMTKPESDRKIAMARAILGIVQAHALGKVFKEPAP